VDERATAALKTAGRCTAPRPLRPAIAYCRPMEG